MKSPSPWQGHIHGEHVDPEFNLALLDPGLVGVVQGARLDVLGHQLAAHLENIMIHHFGQRLPTKAIKGISTHRTFCQLHINLNDFNQ